MVALSHATHANNNTNTNTNNNNNRACRIVKHGHAISRKLLITQLTKNKKPHPQTQPRCHSGSWPTSSELPRPPPRARTPPVRSTRKENTRFSLGTSRNGVKPRDEQHGFSLGPTLERVSAQELCVTQTACMASQASSRFSRLSPAGGGPEGVG